MSADRSARPIVVGFDGSSVGTAALDWALAEAADTGRPVRCVVAMPPLYEPAPMAGVLAALPDEMGEQLGQEAQAHAQAHFPEVPMHTSSLIGGVAGALVEASAEAELLVVGRGEHTAMSELFTGSTSAQVIAHAHCPVVVVETGHAHHDGAIVVGIDGSAPARAALGYAFDVAARRRASVHLVHAWWVDYYPEAYGQGGMDTVVIDQVRDHAQRLLTEAVTEWSGKYPQVPVTSTLARMRPADAILEHAGDAQLVVVGSRGHGGFAGLLIGSTSQGLLHRHRPCPLAVVHAP